MLYPLCIAGATLVLLTWTWLLLARGGFWRVKQNLFAFPQSHGSARVAAIVPARDEARTIAPCITSLLQQEACELHVFLVDDASSDGTAEVARNAAHACGMAGRLTVIPGCTLPPGWSGKLWALEQGIAAADAWQPDFLLLTDADIVHAPGAVASLAAAADAGGYDLFSLMVKLHCETMAEKLLIPAFVFFFFKLYPPAWAADMQRGTAAAAGGCVLIRPESLARAGCMAAIRGEIIDDCALARAVKRSGGRIRLALTRGSVSVRRYSGLGEIGRMIARTAFSQLHHSTLLLVATVIGMAILYVAPVGLLFSGRVLPVAMGAAAWFLLSAAYLPTVRFYDRNHLWALTLPAAALFYTGAAVKSAFDFWSGRGGQWKGRSQDRPGTAERDQRAVRG